MSTIATPPPTQPNNQSNSASASARANANASPNPASNLSTGASTPQSSAWSRGPPPAAQSNKSSAIHTPINPSGTPQPQAEGSSQQNSYSANGNGSSGPVAIGGHSRKGSIMVGAGGVDIKQGNLAFGTVDSPNPMLSSSPAVPGLVGTHLSADKVKSFGSIDADADADPNAIKPVRRTSNNPPVNGAKLDAHALFGSKPKPNGAGQAPGFVPGQQQQPPQQQQQQPQGMQQSHDRRQSMSGFQQQNGLPPSHLRPPQQGGMPGQPRSPVLQHGVPAQYNPAQTQGFRPQQQMVGQPGFRPNAGGPQMQPGMPARSMAMGAYGMHPGPQQGYPPNMGGYPQQGYYDYNMYNPQYGVPQWAPQQHAQNQQYNLPVSPRPGPASASPSPAPAQLSPSGGPSPAPTPPSRPPSFSGHQPSPSNASIASIAPSTPGRPMMPTSSSFTPPVSGQSPFGQHLSGSAASFTPRSSKAIKFSRPDGTAVDLKAVAATAKGPATPASTGSGVATPEAKETKPEEPKKKLPTMPVVVRLETPQAREERMKEETEKKKIQEIEAQEEKERQERKARQAKAAAEKEENEKKEKEAAEERRKMEEALAAEQEAAKKAEEEREAVAKAARDAEEKEKAEQAAKAAQEAREKADEKARSLMTPAASTPGSPLASPALAAAGLPPKPVGAAAAAAAPASIPRRPVPAALELDASAPATPTPDTPAPASALSTARPIEDLSAITYPSEVKAPLPELNAGADSGKFRYDRDFLMQFMERCKEKPDSLPPLEEIGLEAESSSGFGNRSSGRGGSRSSMGGSSRNAPGGTGLGIGNIGGSSRSGFPMAGGFGMGNFGSGTLRGSTSEERYNRSLSGARQPSMARTPSQAGGMHGLPSMSLSTSRSGTNRSRGGVKRAPQQSTMLDPDMAPLAVSATSWVKSRPTGNDEGSPEYIERKIKALLNKLTAEKFDSISSQILDWANKSQAETDGMTLKLVIKQIFEKATDEAHWSSMYARLCRFLLERLDPAITEQLEGKPVSGGMLFRKYLVGRCQLDFESGWKAREDAATAAAAKSEEDKERLAQQEKDGEGGKDSEPAILSDEYYAAQKAKRRGLGLVQLIGELYKQGAMIGKGVIRQCFVRLLSNVETPDEEDMESSCKLLTTVGAQFEVESKENMDIVFERLRQIASLTNVSSRVKFMIMDVQDLRAAKWKSKKTETTILTIAEVHQQAAKEQAEKSAAAAQSSRDSISRGGSRAGGRRDAQPGEWQSVAPTARPTPRADFTNLGRGMNSSGSAGPQFGPNSVFNKKKAGSVTPPALSRQASTTNMFSALGDETGAAPADRRTSADAGEAPQRKKLNLKPRSVPMPGEEENGEDKDDDDEEEEEEDEEEEETAAPAATGMSADKAKTKIDSDMKELWGEKDAGGSRNPEDVSEYFKTMPAEHQPLLVQRLVDDIFRLSKYKDAEVVAKGWKQALADDVVSKALLVEGISARMPSLDDDSIDFPQAYKAIALLMRSVALSEEESDALIEKIEVLGNPKVTPKDQITRAFKALDEEAK